VTIEAIAALLKTYSVHLLFLVIVLYASLQTVYTKMRLSSWFKSAGFRKLQGLELHSDLSVGSSEKSSLLLPEMANWSSAQRSPSAAWAGMVEARQMWQFITRKRRAHTFLRKKNVKRTQYNVTIASLNSRELYFCLRPKKVLDAIDYVFEESDVEFPEWGEFSDHYQILTNNPDALSRALGKPLRALLMEVEGVSLELIADKLVLIRISQAFDQQAHIEVERETALQVARYLESQH